MRSEIFPPGFSGLEEVIPDLNLLIEPLVFVLIPILLAVNIQQIKDVLIFNGEIEVDFVPEDGQFHRFVVVLGSESRFIMEVFLFNEIVNFF